MWYAFCDRCSEEIELSVTFLHEADGKTYVCPRCGMSLIADYDEDIESGDGYVRLCPITLELLNKKA